MNKTKKFLLLSLILTVLFSLGPIARANDEIINHSIEALHDLSKIPERDVFFYLLEKAEAIAIFPKVVRLGLGLGAQYGDGLVYRKEFNKNNWYGPAFYKIYGVSFGPQVGIQSTSLILLIMNQDGMEIFYNDGLTLGGNVSVTAGPIGRSFSAEVDLNLDSSIYSYSQSRGLYIGLSVQGAQVKQNRQANRQLYKESIDPEEILMSKVSSNPASLRLLQMIKDLITKNSVDDY
jgi:lipid-binding SYLF domain-containing protein